MKTLITLIIAVALGMFIYNSLGTTASSAITNITAFAAGIANAHAAEPSSGNLAVDARHRVIKQKYEIEEAKLNGIGARIKKYDDLQACNRDYQKLKEMEEADGETPFDNPCKG